MHVSDEKSDIAFFRQCGSHVLSSLGVRVLVRLVAHKPHLLVVGRSENVFILSLFG